METQPRLFINLHNLLWYVQYLRENSLQFFRENALLMTNKQTLKE